MSGSVAISSQTVFWMFPPQNGLAAPSVVGSSLVTTMTSSLALTTAAGASVGFGAALGWAFAAGFAAAGFAAAGSAVAGMASALGLATSGAGAAEGSGAAAPQATINILTITATLSHNLPSETWLRTCFIGSY